MNRHTTGRRGRTADREAAARRSRLRAAGVPSMVDSAAAWFLTGGVMGTHPLKAAGPQVSLAAIAKRVPDCEHFLPDYQGHVAPCSKCGARRGEPCSDE